MFDIFWTARFSFEVIFMYGFFLYAGLSNTGAKFPDLERLLCDPEHLLANQFKLFYLIHNFMFSYFSAV